MANSEVSLKSIRKKIIRPNALQRNKYKFIELGGALKSTVALSDKQLKTARREFEKSWAEVFML